MEGFKGTPGPWFAKPVAAAVVEGDLNVIQTNSSHGKGYHVGYVSTWGDNEQTSIEAQANANLIAAAPELLEALQEVVAAIKITLRVGHDRIIELGGECDSPEVMIKGHSEIARAEAAIAKALG